MITVIDGVRFGQHKVSTFWDWLNKKGVLKNELEKFSPKDKLKVVLRWKWGLEDDKSVQELEQTRQAILEQFKRMPPNSDVDRFWLKNALLVESKTNEIKAHFGLISQAEYEALEKIK